MRNSVVSLVLMKLFLKKLLPYTNARNWPHVIHMGFVTEWVRRMRQEWSETSQCPELLRPPRSWD